jgi:hypothetical protein
MNDSDLQTMADLPLRPVLSFRDPAYEKQFVKYYNKFYYRYAQISLSLGLVLIFGDFIADFLAFPSVSANRYRLELCIPVLLVGLACSFSRYIQKYWQPVMAGFIALISFSLFWALVAIDQQGGMGIKSWVGILNFIFLEFYCFAILGVQFNYAFVSGAIILLVFESVLAVIFRPDWWMFGYWSYHVVTSFMLAVVTGWWREFVLRKDFSAKTGLESEVKRRTREIIDTQHATILVLAAIVGTRDKETGNHVRRTQHYVKLLATRLQNHPAFAEYLTDEQIEILFESAPLHDIGKVGIPDRILLKPGRFDAEEFEIMKTHTTIGHAAIEEAESQLGVSIPFLSCAKEIALNHQEKWDGSGYPQGRVGTAIPISARLMALADVYDALRSHRVYKAAMAHDEARAIIIDGRGSQFDPDVTDAFAAISDQFAAVADRYPS